MLTDTSENSSHKMSLKNRQALIGVCMIFLILAVPLKANSEPIITPATDSLLSTARDLPTINDLRLGQARQQLAKPLQTSLTQLNYVLSQQLIHLKGMQVTAPLESIGVNETLSSLLSKTSDNRTIRDRRPFMIGFGALSPAEPSVNSTVNHHFSVDCKRPAAYRVVIFDESQQLIFAPFLPASVVQADGTRERASLMIKLDGQPLGSQFRSNGVNPVHHELSAELRARPGEPVTPSAPGKIQLDLQNASIALVEFGILQ